MRTTIATLASLLALALAAPAGAQGVEPAYSRGGFDYFSAVVEPAQTRTAATRCEQALGKHSEVQVLEATGEGKRAGPRYRCSVPSASEPRLTEKLNEEIALADQFPEPRRTQVVGTLIDKYRRLAQCPAGTTAMHDGTLYVCAKAFEARELCPSGTPKAQDGDQVACEITSCPKGATDLAALTRGEQAGCFRCPRGSFDPKETEAFHGAAKGLPSTWRDVFCRAPAAAKR